MTLNPITALSEQLQKLIIEHGSSAILRDHLALFKDQVLLLEKENVSLRQKAIDFQSEKEVLEAKNHQLTKDNEELRGKIQVYEQRHSNLLEDIEIKILLFLAAQADKFTADQIAGGINENVQIVAFHMKELTDRWMTSDLITMGSPRRWYLAHEGRRYLIEHKLIS